MNESRENQPRNKNTCKCRNIRPSSKTIRQFHCQVQPSKTFCSVILTFLNFSITKQSTPKFPIISASPADNFVPNRAGLKQDSKLANVVVDQAYLPRTKMADQVNHWTELLVGKVIYRKEATGEFDANTQYRESDLPSPYRILRPGTMTTMEFIENRLNVHVDDADKCTRVAFN